MRQASVGLLLLLATLTHSAPASTEPVTLFSCPTSGACYTSPRNCIDDCNAAFSMIPHANGSTTFNMTMMSPLKYTAVLIKDLDSAKYDKAIICSFHSSQGIVARVNYPDPIVIHQFVDATEPDGHTDTSYTQCSTTISAAQSTRARFRMISGKWKNELVIDEDQAVDMMPAVENAKIMSNAEEINFPSTSVAAVRSFDIEAEEELKEKASKKRPFEKKVKEFKAISIEDTEEHVDEEEEEKNTRKKSKGMKERKRVTSEDDHDDKNNGSEEKKKRSRNDSEEETPSRKDGRGKSTKAGTRNTKRGRMEKDDEDDEEDYKRKDKRKKKGKHDDDDHEYDDDDDEDHKEDSEEYDPDHASGVCVLASLLISLYSVYFL